MKQAIPGAVLPSSTVASEPQRKVSAATYARFLWRVPGFIVDLVVSAVLSSVLALLVSRIWSAIANEALPMAAAPALLFIVAWLYPAICDSSRWKATVGKRLFGLRTVDTAGRRLSFKRASARSLARLISWSICLIGFVLALMLRKNQTLHDRIAGTVVVYLPGKAPVLAPLAFLPRSAQHLAARLEWVLMLLLSTSMLTGAAWVALVVLRPVLIQGEATSTVTVAMEQVVPLQNYVAQELKSRGAYPQSVPEDVRAKVTIPAGVTVRYTPEMGVFDIAFSKNPHLTGRVISLVPVMGDSTVKWVCRADGISRLVLAGQCLGH